MSLENNRKNIILKIQKSHEGFYSYCDLNKIFHVTVNGKAQYLLPSSTTEKLLLDELIISGSRSLQYCYSTLHYSIGMCLSFEETSNDTEDNSLKNRVKYDYRNYFARNSIIDYFSFLDYIAYYLYEISFKTIFKEKIRQTQVSFQLLNKKGNINKDLKTINLEIIEKIYRIAFENLHPKNYRKIYNLRNIFVHRYNPGIDFMLKNIIETNKKRKYEFIPKNKLLSFGREPLKYNLLSKSLINFNELKESIETFSKNSKKILDYIGQLGLYILD